MNMLLWYGFPRALVARVRMGPGEFVGCLDRPSEGKSGRRWYARSVHYYSDSGRWWIAGLPVAGCVLRTGGGDLTRYHG